MYQCVCVFLLLHAKARFSPAPVVFSLVLGRGARRWPTCTPRRKFGSRAGSVARALGIQSRQIRQVITGLSAELESSKIMEIPHVSCFALLLLKLSTWWQPRYKKSSRTSSLCGPILCVRGHCICVSVVCYDTRACVVAFGSASWCVGTPHFSLLFVFPLLAAAAAVACRLYHTVPRALKLSTWWQPRYNSSRTASCVDHYLLTMLVLT